MRIAFDFDDTIAVKNVDGSIGEPIRPVVEVIKLLKKERHEILIFSGREDDEIKEWMERMGIPYDKILSKEEVYKKEWDVLVDDRTVNPKGKPTSELLDEIKMVVEEIYDTEKEEERYDKMDVSPFHYDEFGAFLSRML